MKDFDINKRVKLYSCDDFKALGKLSCFNEDDEIIEHLEEASDEGWFALIEGDMQIEGNLDLNKFFEDIISTFFGKSDDYIQLLWITGKLKISNTLYLEETENYCDDMVVENNVTAKNIIAGGTNLYFLNAVEISDIYYYQTGAEGLFSIKGKRNIKIETDNNNIWTIGEKWHKFDEGISQKLMEKIFSETFYFLEADDKELYYLENEKLFIKALLNGDKIFNF
ncbi:MAG: hypothetical protein DRR16_14770 [Candidatus Parabeggiatoa sp. nov. 3]|nr:MAG: hypothetical protein DRR00_12630 [Gammaproteobacteria bacterium]RKZ64334.1 MAG: hypothetical protein DRQ99_15645 [Gammaproteobacteria bacterium]RKZ84424.1 MAG: hypothetical protein DRR16_14770 [Gammaproteobacteria bacterium]